MNATPKLHISLILAVLFPVIHPTEGLTQDNSRSSETVTLVEKVQIPVEVDGKKVGETSLPAGTEVTVVSREGARVLIKRGNLGPVWLEESQLSGLSEKAPEQSSKPGGSEPTVDLRQITQLLLEKKWAQVAAVCERMAQADEKFAGLAELARQLQSALQAQTSAVQKQRQAETEAKRLRRNADVAGQPNRLNPSDSSPMERAQKIRDQADDSIKEAKAAFDASVDQIAQFGADIASEVSRLEDEALRSVAGTRPLATSASNDPTKVKEDSDTDAETDQKLKLQSAMLVLDWPVETHTHEEALRHINKSIEKGILPRIGLTFEDCARKCPIDPKKTYEENFQLQKKLAIQLGKGWTKSAFRCGDILAVVAFDQLGTAADVRYSHVNNALDCFDDSLLAAACRYNEPSARWDELPEQDYMKFSVAFNNSDKPVALMNAKASEIYLSTPLAQAFWNSEKAARASEPKPQLDMDTDASNGNPPSADSHTASESDKTQGAFRRGPKIHGFQVGMTLEEFRTALRAACPGAKEFDWGTRGFRMKSSDPVYSPLLVEYPSLNSFIYREGSDKGPILGNALVLGPSQIVVQLQLTFAVLNNVFETKGLDWKEFCQATVDAYNIPELAPSENSMVYRSEEGWGIYLTPNQGLELKIAPRVSPKERMDPAARGFGG